MVFSVVIYTILNGLPILARLIIGRRVGLGIRPSLPMPASFGMRSRSVPGCQRDVGLESALKPAISFIGRFR